MPILDIDNLPEDVKNDICENLLEEVEYLRNGDFDLADVRNNLLGLVDPVPVLQVMAPIHEFEAQASKRLVSEAAIRNLNTIRDQLIAEGKELDPILIAKDRFIDGGHRFELWRRKGLPEFPAIDIQNLLTMDWERWMEGEDVSVPPPQEPAQGVILNVFHGTFWTPGDDEEPDEHVFTEPDGGFNDHGVTYYTNRQEVAKRFSSYNLTPDDRASGALQVILKGTLTLPSQLRKEAYELQCNPYIDFPGGESIHINYRDDLYAQLRAQNLMALTVGDEYGDGDDIAVLEPGFFECEAVALQKQDGSFTAFMEPDQAIQLFNRHVRLSAAKQDVENDPEP